MKRAVLPLVLSLWAAGCARSGEITREGFLYDRGSNQLVFRQMYQAVHTVWESGGYQVDVEEYGDAWRVRFIGPRVPKADDVILTNRLTHDRAKVDYKGKTGRSDRFYVRLADTKDLGVDVGRNVIDYAIVDDDHRELASGRFVIDVAVQERQLPDRTVFVEEPRYYFGFDFEYNHFHHSRPRRHGRFRHR